MQEIIIKVPDNFTEEQVAFIKQLAINQIEAEIKTELTIPQEQIDACETKINEVKTAMGMEIE